jgi:hypothetical protein
MTPTDDLIPALEPCGCGNEKVVASGSGRQGNGDDAGWVEYECGSCGHRWGEV